MQSRRRPLTFYVAHDKLNLTIPRMARRKGAMSMITQIYSIQTVAEAEQCIAAGADRIGVNVAVGANLPAEVSVEQCAEIFAAIGSRAVKVLIVVTSDEAAIYEPLLRLQPDVLHICGYDFAITPEFAARVRALCPNMELMQAIGVEDARSIAQAEAFAEFCDILILDSVDKSIAGIGAAGITHDWRIDAEIVRRVNCRVILAGGLDADNVADAIRAVRPWGVDSFTRTSDCFPDGSSRKNPEKVRAFIAAARAAGREIEA